MRVGGVKAPVNRVQLTSDGNKSYLDAVERAFGGDINYAMLMMHYGPAPEGSQRRYSPAECVGTTVGTVTGQPDQKHTRTSYADRASLNPHGRSPLHPPGQRFLEEG
jgi:hypothetical protein